MSVKIISSIEELFLGTLLSLRSGCFFSFYRERMRTQFVLLQMVIIVFFMIGTCMRNPCILLIQLILNILGCIFLILFGIGFFVAGSKLIGWLIDQPDEKGKKEAVAMSTFIMIFLAVCYFIWMIFAITGTYLTYLVYGDAKRYKALSQGY
ncbi:hypothetical protein WR25_03303 isoform B [Diploscapter pachys]|uniref:Uncharacterized protein n=2 Tax=Diploscapter pachys TaxID=2018661 RepID=A0A2A2L3K1_9BILA|nr:hypothetical protein WR25_03303 isoform B [Diploscapter pachys]